MGEALSCKAHPAPRKHTHTLTLRAPRLHRGYEHHNPGQHLEEGGENGAWHQTNRGVHHLQAHGPLHRSKGGGHGSPQGGEDSGRGGGGGGRGRGCGGAAREQQHVRPPSHAGKVVGYEVALDGAKFFGGLGRGGHSLGGSS